jgi:hypothetical protein
MTFPINAESIFMMTGVRPDDPIPFCWFWKGIVTSIGETNQLYAGDQITVAKNKKGREEIVTTKTYPTHEIVSCHYEHLKIKDLVTNQISDLKLYL